MTDPAVDTTSGEPGEGSEAPPEPKSLGRKILSNTITIGLVIAIFVFLVPKLEEADLSEVASYLTWERVLVALLLGGLNLTTNWPPMVIALPGLRYREAAVSNLGPAAVSNTVPEGGAVATGLVVAMQRSWGFPLPAITLAFLVTGLWTNVVRYSITAAALLVYALSDADSSQLITFAVILVAAVIVIFVLLVLVFRSATFAERLGRGASRPAGWVLEPFHRPPPDLAATLVDFRTRTIDLVRTRWKGLTVSMTISQLSMALVLLVCVRMVGVDNSVVSVAKVIVAWGAVSFASILVPVPGGIGVAEVVLVGVLTAGLPPQYTTPITAAVVLYRMATWLLPIPLGAGAYLFWRYNHSWRAEPGTRERGSEAMTS
jgi:uncharacterized membrane protein YbhN (UPF0104 family)